MNYSHRWSWYLPRNHITIFLIIFVFCFFHYIFWSVFVRVRSIFCLLLSSDPSTSLSVSPSLIYQPPPPPLPVSLSLWCVSRHQHRHWNDIQWNRQGSDTPYFQLYQDNYEILMSFYWKSHLNLNWSVIIRTTRLHTVHIHQTRCWLIYCRLLASDCSCAWPINVRVNCITHRFNDHRTNRTENEKSITKNRLIPYIANWTHIFCMIHRKNVFCWVIRRSVVVVVVVVDVCVLEIQGACAIITKEPIHTFSFALFTTSYFFFFFFFPFSFLRLLCVIWSK